MKKYTLFSLRREGCWYIATMINNNTGTFKDESFLYYTKKEIFQILRKKHDCIVSHDFY